MFAIFRLAVLGLVVGTLACSGDVDRGTGPEPDPYLAPSSPTNVLENLAISYRLRDIDGYDAVMDESFIFQPSESDDVDFDELAKNADYESTRRMFEQVENIEIRLAHSGADSSDFESYPGADGYMKITVPSVFIRVLTRDGEAHDPLIYLVDGDPAVFIFEPIEIEGGTHYKIVFQQDLHSGSRRGEETLTASLP